MNALPVTPLLLTMDQAAEALGMCRRTLLAHVRAGDIRFVLIGKRTRKFAQSDLAEFIERQKVKKLPLHDERLNTAQLCVRLKVLRSGDADVEAICRIAVKRLAELQRLNRVLRASK